MAINKQYDYIYKRRVRKPVEVDPYLRYKLVFIINCLIEDFKLEIRLNPIAMRNNVLLDKFEELVDNVNKPKVIKRYSNEFDKYNKKRTHVSLPDRKNKKR